MKYDHYKITYDNGNSAVVYITGGNSKIVGIASIKSGSVIYFPREILDSTSLEYLGSFERKWWHSFVTPKAWR